MMNRLIGAAIASAAVASCSAVGPDFAPPRMPLAERFAFAPSHALMPAATQEWWRGLDDPVLDRLMDRAMRQNLDIEAARARILQAEALLRTEGVAADLTGAITADQTYSSAEGRDFEMTNGASFNPSFVLDVFGGRRRSQQAATADLYEAIYSRGVSRLAVQLAVTRAYLNLRFFERSLAVRQSDIRNKSRLVSIVRDRAELQDATAVDLRRSEAQLATARARIPALIAGRRAALLSLAALLAAPAQDPTGLVPPGRGQPTPDPRLDPGVPAALVQNRPDIRAAEARLAAAVAEIGIFEAQLYPSLRISGTLRASAVDTVQIGPALSLPVLNRTVLKARRDAAKARALEAEILWRQTVVGGIDEVQQALVRLDQNAAEVRALNQANRRYEEANRLSREAFNLAAITLQEVFETEDDRTQVELQLAAARRDLGQSWAQLNVAIGQGWIAPQAGPEGAAPVILRRVSDTPG